MTQDQPSRLDRLEALLADVGDVALQNAEVTNNHDTALNRIEGALQQLTSRVDALTTSTTDLARTAAEQAVQAERDRQAWQAEIRRIWEYLLGQSGNGRGSGQASE